ncbi:MAG: hypothetical protein M1834_008861 [Cirrosporium novae-zelandiae]|nr:MAG: hypothetical protein M1834_008861 [Cirrosporium novae-zelandiae]
MTAHRSSPGLEPQTADCSIRKRVCKACDRCRLKKSKCDGANPCSRCRTDNAICVFGERKKYVEMLEQQQAQLVAGLQEMYRRAQTGEGWPGTPLKEASGGSPLTHDILERLGALKHDSHSNAPSPQHFEDDLSALQKKLIEGGASIMQRSDSSTDSDSEHIQTPVLDASKPVVTSNLFSDPLAFNQFPPTPPMQASPFPEVVRATTPLKPRSGFIQTALAQGLSQGAIQHSWMSPISTYDDSIDFIPNNFDVFSSNQLSRQQMTSDWNDEEAFNTFLNTTTMT